MMSRILLKLKEYTMKTENIFIISATLSLLAIVGAITYHNSNELKSIERNVESAIVKGIDPIAVRCAYESNSTNVCVAYASSPKR
jgi:hypothetical protein